MISGKKIVVVMPAYNAEKTLKKTFDDIPKDVVDEIILTDDASSDKTVEISKDLNIKTFVHDRNKGPGANQKTCFIQALIAGADVVVVLHPDYQYNPKLIAAMSSIIAEGIYDVVICSRLLDGGALKGGMPIHKYIFNRFLTFMQNIMTGHKFSEYHTGYRAFSRKVLESLPILENSDDFAFSNQMLLQVLYFGFGIGEISCPAYYHKEASTISFNKSLKYGIEALFAGLKYMLAKAGLIKVPIFDADGKKIHFK